MSDAPNNGETNPPQTSKSQRFWIISILIAVMVVAGFVVRDATEDYRKQLHAVQHYLPVQAKVLSSEVKAKARSSRSSGTSWHPAIRYSYEVGGKRYTSRRYSYSYTFHNTRSFVEEAVAKYPAGATVTAYYNPDNPKAAVLDNTAPDMTLAIMVFAAFGAIFLFIATVVLRHFYAERRNPV
jgi:hypothetical protein